MKKKKSFIRKLAISIVFLSMSILSFIDGITSRKYDSK